MATVIFQKAIFLYYMELQSQSAGKKKKKITEEKNKSGFYQSYGVIHPYTQEQNNMG